MSAATTTPTSVVSYDVAGAAAATGHSVDVIRRAIRSGELVAHYPTSKPVVMADELREWILRAPTTRTPS